MQLIRAGKKIEKAIDALVSLQQDYNEECQAAGIMYDLQTTIDKINSMGTAIDSVTEYSRPS